MDDHKFNFQMPLSIQQETLEVLKSIEKLLRQIERNTSIPKRSKN